VFGNLVGFLSFYRLSAPILEGSGPVHSADWVQFAAWGLAGLATVVLWALALLPVDLWVSVLGQCGGSLAAGTAIGTAAYGIGFLAQNQWQGLSSATLWLVRGMLSVIFPATVYRPQERMVGTRSFHVEIGPQCSGYEGMALIAALMSVALWMFRRDLRFPRALALLPLGIILMWVANAVRITLLLVLGTCGYPEFAVGGFHSLVGWLFFLSVGFGLIAWARRAPYFSAFSVQDRNLHGRLDAAYLMPAMAVVAVAMITGALSPGFDRFYAVRVVAATAVLVCYRQSYSELHLKWSWEAVVTGCGVSALWMALEPAAASASAGSVIGSGVANLPRTYAAAWLIFRVIGSVIAIPLVEELAFRGYLTRRLIASDFQSVPPGRVTWWSFLVSSLLFGALHGRWSAGSLAGMAYCLAYRRRGELVDAVVAHAVTNALIAVAVLTAGYWSLWG
jgi:exosortase E/protease (VPEID-CTERM system)